MIWKILPSAWAPAMTGALLTTVGIIGGMSCTEGPTAAEMSRYSTVAIKPVNSTVCGTSVLSASLSDAMAASIKTELEGKGYVVTDNPDAADLTVSALLQEGQQMNPSNAGTRPGQADPFPRHVDTAAFVFYLVDRDGKKVWQDNSGPDMSARAITESRISSIIKASFESLPAKNPPNRAR